ncbi:hypothetical protein LCGC14_0679250 [marine sediment metagenome]|uniref:Uncharacterized protein n=1 Tax=marine sediment metagenome TaxID=412755 RepID=A0A0F9QNR8_9ZZZZ
MGFSIKELTYKDKYLLYLTEQEFAGSWFAFKIEGEEIETVPVILKNIEPTPIYNMVNTRSGRTINRITLDFNVTEYFDKLVKENKLRSTPLNEKEFVRLYIDIFNAPKVPYINTFFTLKNTSDFILNDFSMYFIFDFDINGLDGFDNDLSGYDKVNDIIYQYDKTGLHGGFSLTSKSSHYESGLTKDFRIDHDKLYLSNTLYDGEGEILSALQTQSKTLKPGQSFQTALVISGGFSQKELIDNIKRGKNNAMKHLNQVYRSVKSEQRNIQEEAFIKINLNQAKDCE